MRLTQIRIQNYRTIVDATIDFPRYYTAICGRNDAGKSNIIRLLRNSFVTGSRFVFSTDDGDISIKNDFTKWKEKDIPAPNRFISFTFVLKINQHDDEGLFQFLKTYLGLQGEALNRSDLLLSITIRRVADEKGEQLSLSVDGIPYEELKAQEVYKRLRSSLVMLFHDSTEFFHPFRFRETANLLRQMSASDEAKVKAAQANVSKIWTNVAKKSQQDLSAMLGRLKDKYEISLTIANTAIEDVPYRIMLSTADGGVELENWGSGTQNRTRILMTLFQAKQVRDAATSSDKITPIIIIEEPESYLHPSAQAEFGRTLRDLAEEFKIQVVVTTHSPYLLSLGHADGNVLLCRKVERKRSRETEVISTSGDNWV